MLNYGHWPTNAAQERRTVMKKKVKKLRIGKETLLPLESRQMKEVVGEAISDVAHLDFPATKYGHVNVTAAC